MKITISFLIAIASIVLYAGENDAFFSCLATNVEAVAVKSDVIILDANEITTDDDFLAFRSGDGNIITRTIKSNIALIAEEPNGLQLCELEEALPESILPAKMQVIDTPLPEGLPTQELTFGELVEFNDDNPILRTPYRVDIRRGIAKINAERSRVWLENIIAEMNRQAEERRASRSEILAKRRLLVNRVRSAPRIPISLKQKATDASTEIQDFLITNNCPMYASIVSGSNSVAMAIYTPPDVRCSMNSLNIYEIPALESINEQYSIFTLPLIPGISNYVLEFMFDDFHGEADKHFFSFGDYGDSDYDGYSDYEEIHILKTNPNEVDYLPEPSFPSEEALISLALDDEEEEFNYDTFRNGREIKNQESYQGKLTVSKSGMYTLNCSADDYLSVSVGTLSATSYWSSSLHRIVEGNSSAAFFETNVEYNVSYSFEDYGGEKSFSYALKPVLDTPPDESCEPTFKLTKDVVKVSKKSGEICEDTELIIEDPKEDGCATYTVETFTDDEEKQGWFKKQVYHFYANGVPKGTAECRYIYSDDKDKQCEECCSEGFDSTNGCVSVKQKFGRSATISGLPAGRIVVQETSPTEKLYSRKALKYDHPIMREIVWADKYDAIIKDGLGELVEYRDGKPANQSSGLSSHLYFDGTNYVEQLSSDLAVVYQKKRVSHLQRKYGNRIPVSNMGITVRKDPDGVITEIESLADGKIVATNLTNRSWQLYWTAPGSTNMVKRVTFTCENAGDVRLEEYRNEDFRFNYHWTYDAALKDWRYEKGANEDVLRSEKAMVYNVTNKTWQIEERIIDANTNVVTSVSSVLDVNGKEPMTVARSSGDDSLYSSRRDDRGFVEEETNETGQVTTYTRDHFGRVVRKLANFADTLEEETTYRYAPSTRHHPDMNPIEKLVRRDGVVIEHEIYEYTPNRKTVIRICGNEKRKSFIEYDDYGRERLKVAENGRATKTTFDGLSERREYGIYDNGFELVNGKSTKTELQKSAAGNVTNQVEYAYIGDDWHEIERKSMTHDAAHRVTSTTYSNGKTSAAEYICTGPVWTRDEQGIVISNEYNSVKALKKSTRFGPHGAVETSYVYDGAGRVISETQSAEGCPTRTRTMSYDNRGRIVSETGFDGRTINTFYGDHDKVTMKVYADGGTNTTTVASDGTLISNTGNVEVEKYYTYGVNEKGETWQCVRFGADDSPKFEKTYKNAFGEVVKVESSGFNGIIINEKEYDEFGRLIRETETGKPTKTYGYDSWGDLCSVQESADGVTRTTASTNCYKIDNGVIVASRTASQSSNDIAAISTSTTSQVSGLTLNNESSRVSVDKYKMCREETSSFDITNYTHKIVSSYAAISNNAVRIVVDGLVTETISESAVTNRFEYNAYGWRTAAVDGRGNRTTYEYDARGNLIRETDAAGGVKSYGYDAMNRKVAETNEVGNVTTYSYDTLGRKVYEGGGTYPVRYGFDQYGNQTTMTTYLSEAAAEGGDTTSWVYDVASGLVTQKRYADGLGPSYIYSPDGKLLSRTWARGVTTNYSYDEFGNLTSITYTDDTPPIAFTYDALGRVTSITDASGTSTYFYNVYGDEEVVSHTGLYEKILTRHFDGFGRDLGHTLDGSRMNELAYDEVTGRIRRERLGGAWYAWNYLPGTDLKSSLSIGTAGSTTWEYEQTRDLLTSVTHHFFDSDISTYTYANDAARRRISKNDEAYGYNERDELTSVTTNSVSTYAYSYDDIGNRVTSSELGEARAYSANSLNQYIGDDYDLDGNQTNIVTSTGTWAVTYNAENRPVNWQCGATNIVMKYDHMGRRVEYIETISSVTNAHHKFVYDGYLQLQCLNGSDNSVDLAFEWDPTEPVVTRPLFIQTHSNSGSQSYFFTQDGNKNVSDVVSYQRARGVVAHYNYAPFGAVTSATGSLASINPFRFSSEYHDDTLGLVYYNYRHYNPNDGRWIGRDILKKKQGNEYLFVEHKILSSVDILGAMGLTVSKNTYQYQKYRIITEWVKCGVEKDSSGCDVCANPCVWERMSESEQEFKVAMEIESYRGGLTAQEIAYGIAEEIVDYGSTKAKGFALDYVSKKFFGRSLPSIPFYDEIEAIANERYHEYIGGETLNIGGEEYIFSSHTKDIFHVNDSTLYPRNHLIAPSCKNNYAVEIYAIPNGSPYWKEE